MSNNQTIKQYQRNHIGETFISNEGYTLEVVDGGSKEGYCTVRIDDKYETEVQFSCVKRGKVKNLFHLSVRGVGFVGLGKYLKKTHKKAYDTWHSMLERCYSEKYHEKRPTYKDATVAKEWHNFQNFSKWYKENYVDGYELDKDLLSDGDKIYSPSTCIFIPQALNSFLINKQSTNKSGHIGVSWSKCAGKWGANISNGTGKLKHLGRFTDKEEATNAYKAQRAIYAKEWQIKMKGILPQEAIDRIQ